jgi:hypothetical protein
MGKISWYPSFSRMGGIQRETGLIEEEENIFPSWEPNCEFQVIQPEA